MTTNNTSLPYPDGGKFVVAGDWHAVYAQARQVIQYCVEHRIDTIIHVGDFGFYEHAHGYLKQTNNALKQAGIHLYALDGNHEQFSYLFTKPLDETTGLRPVRTNITHLPRNTRWSWDNVTYLALGGAASIDFQSRVTGKSWWPEEAITIDEVRSAIDAGPVDVMFTHDCPHTLQNPITMNSQGQREAIKFFGEQGYEYSVHHQKRLAEVTDEIKPKILFHGHFHVAYRRWYTHSDGSAAYGIGLDQGGSPSNYILYSTKLASAAVAEVTEHRQVQQEEETHEHQD